MGRTLSAVAVLMVGTAVGSTLDAQTCLGLNPPTNVQLLAETGNGAKTFGATVALGGATGVFGGVGGHYASIDDDGGNAKGVTGHIGAQIGLGAAKKAQLCPVGSVTFSFGPNFSNPDVDFSEIDVAGGLSVGVPVAAGSDFTLIPTTAILVIYRRDKTKVSGISTTESDGFGALNGGVGFMVSPRFVFKPFVSIPIGKEGHDPTFGIVVSIGVGKGS